MARAAVKVQFTIEVDNDAEGDDRVRLVKSSTKHVDDSRGLQVVAERKQDDAAEYSWDSESAAHADIYC